MISAVGTSRNIIVSLNGVNYVKPDYSNTRVDKAAQALLNAVPGSREYKESLVIINQWRSSHLWPLDKVRNTLKNRSSRVDRGAITVQRLKRLSSIENKLIRLTGTRLTGMQDIGGCRAIVKNVDCVNRIVGLYEDARDRKRLDRSALVTERDYIHEPQDTGYRGVHLVIRYQSQGLETCSWTGRKIEIQLRTRLQHNWATALESVSSFIGQQLKANLGDPQWLRFFALASGIFAVMERTSPVPGLPDGDGLYTEILDLWNELNVRSVLHGIAVIGAPEPILPGMSRFVLKLDASTRVTTIFGFEQHDVIGANEKYNELEQEFARRSDIDVVLVKADDMRELKAGYPNYWADTTEFSRMLQTELERHFQIEL